MTVMLILFTSMGVILSAVVVQFYKAIAWIVNDQCNMGVSTHGIATPGNVQACPWKKMALVST